MGDEQAPRYGSDHMVEVIQSLGLRYVSLNPGSSFRGLHDSLVNFGGNVPEIIECPHEKVAVGMAHGYARATGEPMGVILHNVVGLLHGTMAIYNAHLDRCPVMVFGGAGPMDTTRRRPNIDWTHSANVQGNAVRDYTKWDDQPASLAAVAQSIVRGYRVAMSEPRGPVYIALDAGLQEDELESELGLPDMSRLQVPSRIGPDPDKLDELADLLVAAKRPVLVPGYVGRDPEAFWRLVELAELLGLAVLDTTLRHNFPNRHPLYIADQKVLEDTDLVCFMDVKDMGKPTQSHDTTTREISSRLPAGAKVVDVGFNELGLNAWSHDFAELCETDLQVTADATVALPLLLRRCQELVADEGADRQRERQARRDELAARHERTWQGWRRKEGEAWDASPVSTARLAAEVWEAVREHDWVLTVGTAAGWALRTWDFDRPYRYAGRSVGVGMHFPIALGVALAHRDAGRLVVDLQPDGDLMYDVGALWVASYYRIPLLVVMFNNRAYYNDWHHQELLARQRGNPVENAAVGMELDRPAPDFGALARGLGWHGEGPIDDPGKVADAVRRAVEVVTEERRPALVDVVCQPR